MFIIYVLNLFDVQQKHLTKDYFYDIYIYSLIRVKYYKKINRKIFLKISILVLAIYSHCGIIYVGKQIP